jgi:hypothetical protein
MGDVTAFHELSVGLAELGEVRPSALEEGLRRSAELATATVPGCRCAALTLTKADESVLAVASHPEAAALAEQQERGQPGPLAAAEATPGQAVYLRDAAEQRHWPRFRSAALGLGVRCALGLALTQGPVLVACLLCATRPRALGPAQYPLAALLIRQTATLAHNARLHDECQLAARQLQRRAASRTVIEQAKGILMRTRDCDDRAAFAELTRLSQATQVKLVDVAHDVVRARGGRRD